MVKRMFSSPGTPNTTSTPSFSKQRTRSSAAPSGVCFGCSASLTLIVSSPEFRPRRCAGRSAAYPGRLVGRLRAGATRSSVGPGGAPSASSVTARSSTPSSSDAVATAWRTADSSWPDPCYRLVVLLLSVTGTLPHFESRGWCAARCCSRWRGGRQWPLLAAQAVFPRFGRPLCPPAMTAPAPRSLPRLAITPNTFARAGVAYQPKDHPPVWRHAGMGRKGERPPRRPQQRQQRGRNEVIPHDALRSFPRPRGRPDNRSAL
ncbi:exported protein of unknown function [Streptomyces sp. KY75]|nr:exported protein of unknown function [Streptomyces sp. KY75]